MTARQQLESILSNRYETEDEDHYRVELLYGMTDDDIRAFKSALPSQNLPDEYEELLRFSTGFKFLSFDEIRFEDLGVFGFEEVFPISIQLAGDGFGNFWILDIDSKGNWNSVYYVCHDPPVVVKQADDLSQFIKQVDEFGKIGRESVIDVIHEKTVFDIWMAKQGIMEKNENDYDFGERAIDYPKLYQIADLKDAPVGTGFPWGKAGPRSKIIRPSDDPIWIVEKKDERGLFSRLFNRGKK